MYIVIYPVDDGILHSFVQFFQRYLFSTYCVLGPISGARKSFLSKGVHIFWDCPVQVRSDN